MLDKANATDCKARLSAQSLNTFRARRGNISRSASFLITETLTTENMKTTKIWKLAMAVLVAFSLAACGNDDEWKTRLTKEQKETFAQHIAGEYPGQYIIVYKNKDCKEWTDEEGRHLTEAHEETVGGVQIDVTDSQMQQLFFQDFPVALVAQVVDEYEALSHALAEVTPQAITARYGFAYDDDFVHIKWAFQPNVIPLHLTYGGADHYIRLEFDNSSYYYTSAPEALQQPHSFLSLASTGVMLQLKAIYDGSTLLQRFGVANGNYMHIVFRAD